MPLHVVWAGRQRLDWHSGIENGRLLSYIVEQRALNARDSAWKYPGGEDDDVLGGEIALWPSGVVGVGAKRYHYRRRTHRALLFLGWVMIVTLAFLFVHPAPSQNGDFVTKCLGCLLFAPTFVLGVAGLRAYFASWLERDKDGLTHRSLFGRRSLRWDEIRSVRWNGCILEIRGSQTTIRVGALADLDHLADDIEAHGLIVERTTRLQDQKVTPSSDRK